MEHEYKFTLGESVTIATSSDPYSKEKKEFYFGAKGDSVEETVANLNALKAAHVPPQPVKQAQVHTDQDAPPNLAQRANNSFGPESKEKSYACPQCGTGTVTHKQGVSKKTGKPYAFWGCSNWKEGCKYTSKVSPNLPF